MIILNICIDNGIEVLYLLRYCLRLEAVFHIRKTETKKNYCVCVVIVLVTHDAGDCSVLTPAYQPQFMLESY
jgi:hypothetical protein